MALHSQGSEQTNQAARDTLPLLPVKNNVLFPGMSVSLRIGEERSKRLLSDIKPGESIAIAAVKDADRGVASPENIHSIGILATLLRTASSRGELLAVVQGRRRIRIESYEQVEPYFKATVSVLEEKGSEDEEAKALAAQATELGREIVRSLGLPEEIAGALESIESPSALADTLASNLSIDKERKQELLKTLDVKSRLEMLLPLLTEELRRIEVRGEVEKRAAEELERNQREYYLRQQLKVIKDELGEGGESEIEELRKQVREAGMPEEAEEAALRELERLSKMHPSSPEYTVARTYVSWLLEMPWASSTVDRDDLEAAKRILDESHHGLGNVKERILEHLAVKKLRKDLTAPVLCFVGPPGTGKTSIAKAVAKALGRRFAHISLGGVRDEAEIRGHRRTYVGAMPGRIIQAIRRAGVNNPVLVLDEIDKLGMDFRGDPSTALLEVLDPEQNTGFSDHYLEVPFDLSKVFFIATANILDPLPPALRDRMEVIEFSGYTMEEKLVIAREHLIPRQVERHGLAPKQVGISDEAVMEIIQHYTREAGVRELERKLVTVLRKVAWKVVEGCGERVEVKAEDLPALLGARRFYKELGERRLVPGVSTGLAWTPAGGEVLYIESNLAPGDRGLILTGQLGEVMRESAQAALSYVKAHAGELGIDEGLFNGREIHVHVPAGAIPKDGPSAGAAIATSLVSLLKNKPVRRNVAITGEITLKGRLLPVGGIKEKVLGAQRAGVDTVYLPKWNEKDLAEVPDEVKGKLKFRLAESLDEIVHELLGETGN